MPRNAAAIAVKVYIFLIVGGMLTGVFPVPLTLLAMPPWYRYATLILITAGCLLSLIGIMWPRAHYKKERQKRIDAVLDGSVIEQSGLVLIVVGMLMFGAVWIPIFPMGFFTTACCGGFALAFAWQFGLIQRWRRNLRKLAKSGSSAG